MKIIVLTQFLVLAAVGLCQGQGNLPHSYNYFDFGYERTSYDGIAGEAFDDANGFALDLMASPASNFILATEYHYARPEVFGDKRNNHDLKLGLGGYLPLGDSVSFYTHLGGRYLRANTGIDGFDPSDWGFYVEPGVRVSLGESFELYGAGEYTRILEDNQFAGKAGAVFYFNPNLGIEAFGRFGNDWSNSYGVGMRIGW